MVRRKRSSCATGLLWAILGLLSAETRTAVGQRGIQAEPWPLGVGDTFLGALELTKPRNGSIVPSTFDCSFDLLVDDHRQFAEVRLSELTTMRMCVSVRVCCTCVGGETVRR